ncbi:TPA: ead/Ea22-like family protein [Enterobacter hormaechei subsp. steigerwaltii]|nr:ead/Ea22-like family protein [Enterobacter hormaechei subsp. steigerwaltii]
MSNIDKRALREAAEKATPGRWEYYPGNTSIEYNVDSMDEGQGSIVYVDSGDFTKKQTDLNGAFIAAANPATVLALLDELEAKDKQIADLKEAFSIALSAAGIDVPAAAGKGDAS